MDKHLTDGELRAALDRELEPINSSIWRPVLNARLVDIR